MKFRRLQCIFCFFACCLLINGIYKFWFYWFNYPFVAENVERHITVDDMLVEGLAYVGENITQSVYVCKNTTKLLITVISHVDDARGRQLIRRTWGNYSEADVEIRFVVGYKGKSKFPASVASEQLKFKDLLIANVEEKYYDLSLKTLAVIASSSKFCPSAVCIAKSDDDNIIRVKELKKLCEDFKDTESIHGYCLENPQVLRRKFSSSTKWDVPFFVYPLKRYPFYCRGGHYLITGQQTPNKLLFGLKILGFFKSLNLQRMPEDGIFTGFAAKIAGIKRYSNKRFIPCLGDGNVACIDEMPYPENWISAMIGNKKGKMEYLEKCSLKLEWEKCLHNILFNQSALMEGEIDLEFFQMINIHFSYV